MSHQYYLCLVNMIIITIITTTTFTKTAATDAEMLVKFRSSLTDTSAALAGWDPSVTLCQVNKSSWAGVMCVNGGLYGLKLDSMGLGGGIDLEALARIPTLRSLSLANNSFGGPVPAVRTVGALRALYLSDNRFSGEIPGDCFGGMGNLKKVYLARNGFVGELPKSLLGLGKLMELDVQGNGFQGKIPDFGKELQWKFLSFANNQLRGRIPASLSKVNQSAFSGNIGLCGAPLQPCKSSKKPIITIVIIVCVAIVIIALIVLIFFVKARKAKAQIAEAKLGPPKKQVYKRFTFGDKTTRSSCNDGKKVENGSLQFVRNDRERFELEDLLRASAEVLGSGSFGSSYKAVLSSGPALVVKRFRYMNNLGRRDFQAHMNRLGKLAHPNVLSIVAYYYTKEEKLFISNFVHNGSLATHLHGKRKAGERGLDWSTRLKIIRGVTKGVSYLYREFSDLTLPHGHLKSSNVLLDHNLNPLLSDYSLSPLLSHDHARRHLVAHRSPDSSSSHRVSRKTDVWSLGILILEILTGKLPANYLAPPGRAAPGDLVAWVSSAVREEWTGEVFDKDMGGGGATAAREMVKMLMIGLRCCEADVERRWDWRTVAERIEEVRERDGGDRDGVEHSSYVTDWDVCSSVVSSDEDLSFTSKK